MYNRQLALFAENAISHQRQALAKRAFVAAGQPDPAAAGGAPPMDPAAMAQQGGGAPPMDPAAMGGAPPMDPAMMQQGGAPPMDPAAMGGAPPAQPPMEAAPPAPAPVQGPDPQMQAVEQAVQRAMQAHAQGNGQPGQGQGKSKKIDPSQLLTEQQINRKLLVNLHAVLGAPLPYSVLEGDTPSDPNASGGQPQQGGGKPEGEPKQAVAKGAMSPIKPVQPAFDKVSSVPTGEQAEAIMALLQARRQELSRAG